MADVLRQWEEVGKDEDEITVNRFESKKLVLAQAQMKKKETNNEKKRKMTDRSTNMLEEVASKNDHDDTEEMILWRTFGQEIFNELWK